ncbi:unnamed protein product [Pipistrellus nathusii]|uniref:Mitogen-activated protein kinase n=1 Tax=Pipistrellus nathusii TaxID=59473 RepID=A0ABN9ZL36_PIPNA
MCSAEVDAHVAQRFLLKRRLGKGAYGIVWKAVDRRTGEVVAIKKIFDAFKDKTDAQRTFREVTLLQEFGDHPNIVRFLDVIRAENDRDLYLVLEFMDTDLNSVIAKGSLLKDVHKRYIFYQLLRAARFLHAGRVIHRDLKPSNVLLDGRCLVKLCDFGLARSLGGLPEGPEGPALTEYVATRWYRAPEVLLSSSWPRQELDTLLPPDTPPEALDLLRRLLVFAPDQRLSAAQALQHPYVQRFHCPAREWALEAEVRLPVPEGVQLSAPEYRSRLYQMILERRAGGRAPRETGQGDAPVPPAGAPGAELGASRAQACAPQPGAAPPPPAQDCGLGPAHGAPRGAQNPRQHSAPPLQPPPPRGGGSGERPPGAAAEPPSWAKPGAHAAPSLAAQAAAQGAVQALVRSHRDPGRGARAASAPRVPLARPAEARPGRRMFSAAASQGAQGAARAALGGYSQAYGTVCRSALGRLPLLPGHRV